jgi:hypothetical protein
MRPDAVGAALTLAAALLAAGLTAVVEERYAHLHLAGLGDFALHPVSMALAFLLLAPLAASAFALRDAAAHVTSAEGRDAAASHARAKVAHAALHLGALLLGALGARSIWLTHERSAFRFHFQTLHSWVGVAVLGLYAAQWLVGAVVFYAGGPSTRARLLPAHRAAGRLLVLAGLLACALGSLATVWKPDAAEPHPHAPDTADWAVQNCAGVCMLLELLGVHWLLARRPAARAVTTGWAGGAPSDLDEPLLLATAARSAVAAPG